MDLDFTQTGTRELTLRQLKPGDVFRFKGVGIPSLVNVVVSITPSGACLILCLKTNKARHLDSRNPDIDATVEFFPDAVLVLGNPSNGER